LSSGRGELLARRSRGSAASRDSGERRRGCRSTLSSTASALVPTASLEVDRIDDGDELRVRQTPVKFRRWRAKSRRGRGIGELEEGGEATGVRIGGAGALLL
jgi:hypothetical protein